MTHHGLLTVHKTRLKCFGRSQVGISASTSEGKKTRLQNFGKIWENLGKNWGNLGKSGENWENLGKTGENWEKLGKTGKNWEKLEKTGKSGKFSEKKVVSHLNH